MRKLRLLLVLCAMTFATLCAAATPARADTAFDVSYLDAQGIRSTCDNATVVEAPSGGDEPVLGADDQVTWYVVSSDVVFAKRITIKGTVNLILADGKTLTANKGITVEGDNALTIYSQSEGSEMGRLVAVGESWDIINEQGLIPQRGANAAIGSDANSDSPCGVITINGGVIDAHARDLAAAIGTGGRAKVSIGKDECTVSGGAIIVNGGRVSALASVYNMDENNSWSPSAIGGGVGSSVDRIEIHGGKVVAEGSEAGIGKGMKRFYNKYYTSDGGSILITGGTVVANGIGTGTHVDGRYNVSTGEYIPPCDARMSVTIQGGFVYSSKGIHGNSGSWEGVISESGQAKIYGMTGVTIAKSAEIPSGHTLTIGDGQSLTVNAGATLAIEGTVVTEGGGTFANNGTVIKVNEGSIPGSMSGGGKVLTMSFTPSVENGEGGVAVESIPYKSEFLLTATIALKGDVSGSFSKPGSVSFLSEGGDDLGQAQVTWESGTQPGEMVGKAKLKVGAGYWDLPIHVLDKRAFRVRFSGNDILLGREGSCGFKIGAAKQQKPRITSCEAIGTTITISATCGENSYLQYACVKNGTDSPELVWQTWPNKRLPQEVTGLDPNTEYKVYVRCGGFQNQYEASEPDIVPVVHTGFAAPDPDGSYIDYAKETLSGGGSLEASNYETGFELAYDGDLLIADGESISGLIGKSIYIRVKEDGKIPASLPIEVKLPGRRPAPTNVSVPGFNDEKLFTTSDMEFKTSSGEWKPCENIMTLDALGWDGSSPISVRMAAVTTKGQEEFPSNPLEIKLTARPDAPTATPKVKDRTTSSIEVEVAAGLECRLDDGQWRPSTGDPITFNGLEAGKEYTVYARTPASKNNFASKAASIKVSTLSPSTPGPMPPSTTETTVTKNADGSTTTTVRDKKTGTETVTREYKEGVKVVTVKGPGSEPRATVTLPSGVSPFLVTLPVDATEATVAAHAGTRGVINRCVPTDDGLAVLVTRSCELVVFDNAKAFGDMGGHWAQKAVDFVSARGLMNGIGGAGTFEPDTHTSRAMVCAVLSNLEYGPEATKGLGFADTTGDAWYARAVAWAAETGIVHGYGDGSAFGPNDDVTREQMACMIYNYARAMGMDVTKRADLSSYKDAGELTFGREAMAWCVASGIFHGYDGGEELGGTDGLTRAQCAAVLMNLVTLIVLG